MATLHTVAIQTAALVRGIGIGYVLVQVLIWRQFFTAHPARLAGPVIAAASAALVVIALGRSVRGYDPPGPPARRSAPNAGEAGTRLRRAPPPRRDLPPTEGASPRTTLIISDSAVCVLLALGAQWCVPPGMRGDTASWLYIALAVQLIVPAWFAPARLAGPLALASAAALRAGTMLTRPAGGTSAAAAAAFLLSVAVAVWWGYQVLYRRAARADTALARADRESREQYVLLSRGAERREHERLLHDTVLNTLTALSRPGSGGAADVTGRCWHDVTLVEHMLGAAGEPADAGRLPVVGLRIGLDAVAREMRSRGLVVHVGAMPGGAAGTAVPAPVSAALGQAVREALANVLSHAGTGEAWVDITAAPGTAPKAGKAPRRREANADPGPPAGLRVTVRDDGGGFDPAQVDPSRLGLRRSIIERLADCGGRAMVQSAPGQGTVVSLCWPC